MTEEARGWEHGLTVAFFFLTGISSHGENIIYSGSQKSEVCPMPYAHGGLCPMPMSTSYESSKGYTDNPPLSLGPSPTLGHSLTRALGNSPTNS